jgi:hypothetical protein
MVKADEGIVRWVFVGDLSFARSLSPARARRTWSGAWLHALDWLAAEGGAPCAFLTAYSAGVHNTLNQGSAAMAGLRQQLAGGGRGRRRPGGGGAGCRLCCGPLRHKQHTAAPPSAPTRIGRCSPVIASTTALKLTALDDHSAAASPNAECAAPTATARALAIGSFTIRRRHAI